MMGCFWNGKVYVKAGKRGGGQGGKIPGAQTG